MFGLRSKTQHPAAPAPATTPDERRRVLAAIASEEASSSERLTRLAAEVDDARAREVRARDFLDAAIAERSQLEGEQLALSSASERRVNGLRQQLAASAPPELDKYLADVRCLVEQARGRVESIVSDGYQGLDGRRQQLVSSNVADVGAFQDAARQTAAAIERERYAEAPDLERLGPFAELAIPAAELARAARFDDSAGLVSRHVTVPAALAEQYAAITGVVPPKPLLSPGEARFVEAEAERSSRRRWNTGEAWR